MPISATAIVSLADLRAYLKVGQAAIASAPAPTVSGATLTPSAGGFQPGQPITITIGGTDHSVTVATVEGNAVTWTPDLADAPSAGDVVYDGSVDAMLADIINAVSAEFERETGRCVIQRTLTETRHGDGKGVLALRRRPIASVTSITIDGVALSADDYVYDADSGIVTLKALAFTRGIGNVVIVYVAGWPAADVPSDILFTVRRWCKFIYDEWTNAAVAAQSVTIGSQTFMINPDVPATLRRAVARWVDQRVW